MGVKWILILAVVSSFSGAPAFAEDVKDGGGWTDENCLQLYSLAEKIMKSRQNGVPMPDVISVFDGNKTMRAITMLAYDEPRYSTEPMKQRTIQVFADSIYAECLKQ